MSYEHVIGAMGLPQSIPGSQTMGVMARAHLSLVPDPIVDATPDTAEDEDQWQERALCAQTGAGKLEDAVIALLGEGDAS